LQTGTNKVRFKRSGPKAAIEGISSQALSAASPAQVSSNLPEEKSAIAGSVQEVKKRTLNVKSNSSKVSTLITKSLKIMEAASTLNEGDSRLSWTMRSKEIYKKLSLPTKTDYVDLPILSLRKSLSSSDMGQSWFSITKKEPQKKSLQKISFQSSLVSPLKSMDSEAIQLKTLSKEKLKLKTMKFRLFPTQQEKKGLDLMLEQWRWYYNYTVDVHRDMNLRIDEIKKNIKDLNLKLQGKLTKKLIKTVIDYTYSMPKNIRDEARDYSLDFSPFRETERGNILLQEVKYTPGQDRYYTPPWWKKVNGRVIRGAIFNYQSNLDSAISNRNVGNNKGFEMKYKKKTKDDILVFEDFNFPVALKKIEGYYGYRTNKSGSHKKRTSITVEDVIKNTSKRGCTFVHEKGTNNYYLHYPVEVDYFPSDDRRSNNHAPTPSKESAIFLDPGVRKFLYGFCPDGTRVIVGDHDSYEISTLLLQIDSELDQKTREKLWRKIKGMINDLHWKTIKFLTTNYKIIVLGDIHSQSCLKNPKLPRIVKRILNQYSFHKFKTKLIWACNLRGNDIIFLDEAFTTKACSCCGKCNWKVNKSEVFKCRKCKLILDRDENSSINMAIKSLSLMG